MRRRLERIVVLHQAQRHANTGPELAARRIVDLGDVFRQLIALQERRDRNRFLGFLVDHDRHAGPAIRVAAAGELAPVVVGVVGVHQVGPVAEGAHEADGEPVAGGFAEAGLILHVVRQMRQRVALRLAAVVGDGFVAAGEADRLERQEADLLGIVERELDDAADLLVVDAVHDRDDRNDFDPGACRLSMAFSFTSNRLPTLRCALAALPMPSNCRYA